MKRIAKTRRNRAKSYVVAIIIVIHITFQWTIAAQF